MSVRSSGFCCMAANSSLRVTRGVCWPCDRSELFVSGESGTGVDRLVRQVEGAMILVETPRGGLQNDTLADG